MKEYESKQLFYMDNNCNYLNENESEGENSSEKGLKIKEKSNSPRNIKRRNQNKTKTESFTNLDNLNSGLAIKSTFESTAMLNLKKSINELTDKNARLEKQLVETHKKLNYSHKDNEKLKRKCEVLQSKYDLTKKSNAKEKFIGIKRDTIETNEDDLSPLKYKKFENQFELKSEQNLNAILKATGKKPHSNSHKFGNKNITISTLKDKRLKEKETKISEKLANSEIIEPKSFELNENQTSNFVYNFFKNFNF